MGLGGGWLGKGVLGGVVGEEVRRLDMMLRACLEWQWGGCESGSGYGGV